MQRRSSNIHVTRQNIHITRHRSMKTFRQTHLIRARALTGFAELVSRQGGDADTLLRESGIDPQALNNPDSAVDMISVANLLERAAVVLMLPDLGLRLSKFQDMSVIGAGAMIAQNSATVGDALAALGRSVTYHTPGASLVLEADQHSGYARFRYDLELPEDAPRKQGMELSYAIAYQFISQTTGSTGEDWFLAFRHRDGQSKKVYRQYFSCPVSLGNYFDSLSFPAEMLEQSINQADPRLKDMAERILRNIQNRFPLDISQQVRELIGRQLAHGDCNIITIAKVLCIAPRTLQRRLQDQGVNFGDLVDEVRKLRAAEYLGFGSIPISDISLLLGYAGQTPFTVACKRWFGLTPKKYRVQLLTG